jgi:hypothetical protein
MALGQRLPMSTNIYDLTSYYGGEYTGTLGGAMIGGRKCCDSVGYLHSLRYTLT